MDNTPTQRWAYGDAPTEAHLPAGNEEGPAAISCGAFARFVINDRYVVHGVLGRGATAEVYRAHDQQLEREVAVKLLNPILCTQPEALARFHDEGLVAARVHHPNVAAVFDTGVHDGRPFIVMECLSGGTLADRLARGPLTLDEVRRVALQMLDALQASHERGVTHRDVKPSNILLAHSGVAKLADFGIAKDDESADHTAVGLVVGTPSYMAPERLRGAPATARSDLYALGMVLLDAVVGHRVGGATDRRLDDLARLEGTDAWLAATLARATHPDIEMRFPSAAAMAAAFAPRPLVPLSGAPSSRPPAPPAPRPTRRARTVAFSGLALAVALTAGFATTRALTRAGPSSDTPTPTTVSLPEPLRAAFDDLRDAVGS